MMSVTQYELAFRAWVILVRTAKAHETTQYGKLGAELNIHHRVVRFPLEIIQDYCLKEKLPPLTILVGNIKGAIGKGFIAWDVADAEAGLAKVYAMDWDLEPNPFAFAVKGSSPEEISVALARHTMTPKEAYALVRVRGISQDIFRGALLRAYGGCCAFSGYRGKGLLEAAHIVPWSLSKPEERLDVSNGLLLSVLHHRLFDLEWLRIDENYRIIVNYAKFKRQALSNEEFALVESLDGKAMQLPADERNWPSRDVIRRRYSDRRS